MVYMLKCATCNEQFLPLVATEPGELLFPHRNRCEEQIGELLTDKLFDWREEHEGHEVEEVEI